MLILLVLLALQWHRTLRSCSGHLAATVSRQDYSEIVRTAGFDYTSHGTSAFWEVFWKGSWWLGVWVCVCTCVGVCARMCVHVFLREREAKGNLNVLSGTFSSIFVPSVVPVCSKMWWVIYAISGVVFFLNSLLCYYFSRASLAFTKRLSWH